MSLNFDWKWVQVVDNTLVREGDWTSPHDGGNPDAGGTATLYINDEAVGSTRVEKTQFAIFSADETAGVGLDPETPVSGGYDAASSEFTGTIEKVTITLKSEKGCSR